MYLNCRIDDRIALNEWQRKTSSRRLWLYTTERQISIEYEIYEPCKTSKCYFNS